MGRACISGAAALVAAIILCGAVGAQAQESTPGTKIEVREGDSWTKVTFVKKEGRRTLVRYDDGTEEWVTADRLREGPAAATADPAKPSAESPKTATGSDGAAAPAAAKPGLGIGSAVEYKRSAFWHPGHIVRTQRGWYLVKSDKDAESFWCEPWILRTVGSGYDVDNWGVGSEPVRPGEAAPTEPPGPSPRLTGKTAQTGGPVPGAPAVPVAPPIKLNFDSAADPQPGNGAALSFATTRPTSEFGSATLRPKSNQLASIVACRDTPNVIVVGFGGVFDQPTEVVRFDATTRRPLDVRALSVKNHRIVGAANMGKVLLTTVGDFFPRVMCLWELDQGGYKIKSTFDVGSDRGGAVMQAALIDATHAMYRDDKSDVYLLDVAENKATGYIKSAANCEPFLHPNGQVLAVLTAGKTALLLRTSDFTTIGEFPDAGTKGNVAVDPTGECAAYPTAAGAVRVVKIADGSTVGTIAMGAGFGGHIEMPSPGVVLADYKIAYDAKSGVPIWLYTFPEFPNVTKACLTAAGQVTYVVEKDNTATACVATVPDAVARAALKALGKDAFMLSPGMAVSINGNFSAFGDEADKVSELVHKAITAAGLVVSDKPQPFQINMTTSVGPTERRDYVSGRGPRMGPANLPLNGEIATVSVPCTIVAFQMTHDDKAVWSQEFRFQAGADVAMSKGQTMQDAINAASKPTAGGMQALSIPGYLPKDAVPGAPPALGTSDLSPRGFVPAPKQQQPPQPPGIRKPGMPPVPGRPGQSA